MLHIIVRVLAALSLAGMLLAAAACDPGEQRPASRRDEPASIPSYVASARAAVETQAVSVEPPSKPGIPPEQRADADLKRDEQVFAGGGVLYVPPSFKSDDGAFDLIVHFHGNTELVEESVGAAKINALVLVINAGTGSGPYEQRYALPAVFEDALTRVRDAAEKQGLKGAKRRRLALSSWSAGYGAIAKLIASPGLFDQVDALIMLDGLHVAYEDPKSKAKLDTLRLKPFVRFAKEAAEGKRLFSITHGDTEVYGYATTAEAVDAILREVGIDRAPAGGSPPPVTLPAAANAVPKGAERWLDQMTEAKRGGLRVRGYAGRTPEHHMAHLIQMSVTALPDLAERWR